MNKEELIEEIDSMIVGWQNDIQEYFLEDVPLECYPEDIDRKLDSMRCEVLDYLQKHMTE